MEAKIATAIERERAVLQRAHPYDPVEGHGFIDSQKRGFEVFRAIPPEAPLIVAEAVWQYSHHVLPGLKTHGGPMMHLVLQGITRDQMMARHKSNHIQVVYAPDNRAPASAYLQRRRRCASAD